MSVLEKSALIIDIVSDGEGDPTLTKIAQRMGQPRSSVHRLLAELVQLDLLSRVGTNTYAPGPRLARWGHSAVGVDQIVRIAEPVMTGLRDALGESVHLYVRQRDTRVCVAAVDGKFELRHFTEVGRPLPLSVGASGKLLLAFADDGTQKVELRRAAAKPVTVRAPTADDLRRQLEEIATNDWSTSFGEREEGLAAAAVPIRDYSGQVIAALTVSGPTARLTAERFDQLKGQIRVAGEAISMAMGWSPEATPAGVGG